MVRDKAGSLIIWNRIKRPIFRVVTGRHSAEAEIDAFFLGTNATAGENRVQDLILLNASVCSRGHFGLLEMILDF